MPIYASSVSGHLTDANPIFTLLLTKFWAPPTTIEISDFLAGKYDHCVQQLVANFVFLSFGARHAVYSRFIRAFFFVENDAMRMVNRKMLKGSTELVIALSGFFTKRDTFHVQTLDTWLI